MAVSKISGSRKRPAGRRSDRSSFAVKPLTAALLSIFACNAHALPSGAQVAAGTVGIATAGNTMTLNQASPAAIVNWQRFNIGQGEALRINQQNSSAAMLARVLGGSGSQILGSIQANGRLYLVDPRGVIIGKDAVINTASFLATTLNISDSDFLKGGALDFSGSSMAGVENLGTIHASEGDVFLFAHTVSNAGTLQAPKGTVGLGAANEVFLASPGAPDFVLKLATPTRATTGVENSGLIEAVQSQLQAADNSMYELAINQAGTIRATGSATRNGRVLLTAGNGNVQVSGNITARNADGSGGEILVGGDAHGANANVANAASTTVSSSAVLDAGSSAANGNGGKVVVWSDGTTSFDGHIKASGGAQAGNGGSAEVSGKRLLFAGDADLSAPRGVTGTLLLDPLVLDSSNIPGVVTSLATANVTESAADSISLSAALSSSSANTLTLDAPVVNIGANLSLPNGEIDFGSTGVAGTSVSSASTSAITAHTVVVLGSYQTVGLAGPLTATTLAYIPVSSSLTSLSANNASNAIQNLSLTNGTASLTGDVDIRSTSAMVVANKLTTSGNLTLVAGGDLAFGGGGPTLNVDGTTTLASTGGAFNDNGSLVLGGSGRKILYSSTDAGNFNVTGLGYTQVNPVSFQNDPLGSGNVIYIKTASALPLLTITADGKTITYGSADPTYTASYAGGSTADLTSPVQFQVSGAHSNVGSYSINPYGATSSTYRLSFVNGTLTVNPATLTITANDLSRTYGSSNPTLTATNSSLFNGDTLASVVPGLSLSTTAGTGSNAGSYPITPSGTSASANYTLNLVPGTLTVNPAPLTVSANNASKTYGSANPALGVSYSGFVNGDTAASLTTQPSATTAATTSSNAGSYPITASGAVDPNYSFSYTNGTLTVDPAPLGVTANNASRTYGSANPALGVSYTGFVNGDTVASLTSQASATTSASPSSGVGSYPITVSGAVDPNYSFTYTNGTLTVDPALLTVTANNASKTYGQANPALGLSYSGFVNGESAASLATQPGVATTATTWSNAGSYPITVSGGVDPNYAFSYVNGTLTVNKAPLYISINDNNRKVGEANPVFTAALHGLLNNDAPSVLSGLQLSCSADAKSPAGTYPIVASSLGTATNYAPQLQRNGTLTVSDGATTVLYVNKNLPQTNSLLPPIDEHQNDVRITTAFMGSTTPFMVKMQGEMVDGFSSLLAGSGVKLSSNQINQALADPATRDYMMGTMLPYMYAQLVDILATDPSKWTPEQGAFVSTMSNYIHDEKVAAASKAKQDYQNWEQQQYLKHEQTISVGGYGGVMLDAVNSSNPDMPPPEILEGAQNGVVMTNDQLKAYTGQTIALNSIGTQIKEAEQGSSPGTSSQHVDGGLAGAIADAGRVVATGVITSTNVGEGGYKLVSAVSKNLKSKVFPYEAAKVARLERDMKIAKLEEGISEGASVVEDISKVTKVIEGVGEVLGPVGLVVEVVGNLVQIGVGAAEYAKIGDYKNALDTTIKAANKQVTVSDLKNMANDGTLFNYLSVMTASGGRVGNN